MMNLKNCCIIFLLLFPVKNLSAQYLPAETDKPLKSPVILSKTTWEYHYSNGDDPEYSGLSDSGYKSFYYKYDNNGKLIEYVKYHIFSDLTIKEIYRYNKAGNLENTTRYNAANDIIETIAYKYFSTGKLKKEIHTAYYNAIKPGIYFTIQANVNDDSVFRDLQYDLEIEPIIQSYTITVNISDPDEQNQYIVIGDESDPTSPRYSWSQLSMKSQKGLLGWNGPNRKEHTYIMKNIAGVDYRYDNNGNLISRELYNTANDIIENEAYAYNSKNNRIGFYKYNENGKLSSTEIYEYDSSNRIIETDGLNPDGNLASRLVYKYGFGPDPVEKIWYNTNGDINGRYKYTYDNNYNLLEEIKYRGENEKESRQVYHYDSSGLPDGKAGNLEEIIYYDINDKKEKLIKYVYEYY